MKKILFIVNHPKFGVGGAEIQALRLAKQFINRGYLVDFLCPSIIRKKKEIDENGISILFYRSFKRLRIFELFTGYFFLKKNRYDIYYLRASPIIEGVITFYSKHFLKGSYVVWHCSMGRSVIPFVTCKELWAKRHNNSFFSFLFLFFNAFFIDFIRFYTIKNCSTIIAQTDEMRTLFIKNFKRNSIKINKGIEIPEEFPRKNFNDKINVYFIRNIRERSRLNLYIEIAKKIKKTIYSDKFNFYIIGRNLLRDKNKYDLEIKKLNINYLGFLKNDEVLVRLKEAHILIDTLEEIDDITTYSTAFLEAWINGVIILSFSTNPDNVLDRHKIGFKIRNVDDCILKLLLLNNDKKLMKEMSLNAFNYVKRYHDIKDEVKKIEEIFLNRK